MDDLKATFVLLILGPLAFCALLFIAVVIGLLLWITFQDTVTWVCRRLEWQRPNWAVSHTERPGFNPYRGG